MHFIHLSYIVLFVAGAIPGSAGAWQSAQVDVLPFQPIHAEATPEIGQQLIASFKLTSENEQFGGFSGAAWHNSTLHLVSDRGTLWRSDALIGDDGSIKDLVNWQWSPLHNDNRRWSLDLEALTISPDGRMFTVVEGRHGIFELLDKGDFYQLQRLDLPEILKPSPSNRGIEALATADGDQFLVMSEGHLRANGAHGAALVGPSSGLSQLGYRPAIGFAPTDAGWGADGRLFILERRFGVLSGWQANITEAQINGTDTLARTPLAQVAHGIISDNFECLAIRQHDGKTRATIVSDDNFLFVQSTLLYDIELP